MPLPAIGDTRAVDSSREDVKHDALLLLQTHRTLPRCTKKCERQPSRSHTDGRRVGQPSGATHRSQRGIASGMRGSSSFCPQPHGHRIAIDQSSSPSRSSTRPRQGRSRGGASPLAIVSLRAGSSHSTVFRNHFGRRIMLPFFLREPVIRGGARDRRKPTPTRPSPQIHSRR